MSTSQARDEGRRRARLWPALRARPRLLGCIVFGLGVWILCGLSDLPHPARGLIAWNAGALVYMGLAWDWMRHTGIETIRQRAVEQDEGRFVILAVVVFAAIAVLVAVGTQLVQLKDLHGAERVWHGSLAGLTVLTSWAFTQLLFAQHYAHDFYLARVRGKPDPLAFPGTPDPGYADFLHFSCVIGTASQTADISFNGPTLRPVGTLHCVVAFFFNASLLALSINVVASILV